MVLVHRKAGANGRYWPNQFTRKGGAKKIDEIAISPEILGRSDKSVLSTFTQVFSDGKSLAGKLALVS